MSAPFSHFIRRASFLVLMALATTLYAWAQGKQVLVVERASASDLSACDGATEIKHKIVTDFKIKGKDEFRLIPITAGSALSNARANPEYVKIGREFYEATRKAKYVTLYQLKFGANGILYGKMSENGELFAILPDDTKPAKGVDMPLSSFYTNLVTGEARDGRSKQKFSAPVRDLGVMYFVPEGTNPNDTLFKYAAEEKNLPLWEAFARKTGNYRAAEANAGQRSVLMTCAQDALTKFEQGDYRALAIAQQRAERAQSVQNGDDVTQLLATLKQHKQRVTDLREQVYKLVGESKWDEAIAAAEPIKIYLKTWPDLNTLYDQSLRQSHEQHAFNGEQALKNSQLEKGLSECSTAWQRLPDSTRARACVCQARNSIALRDAKAARARKQPKQAKELLETQLADSDCGRDEGVAKELEGAKCDYAQQFLAEAKQLTGGSSGSPTPGPRRRAGAATGGGIPGVKLLTVQNKPDFRNAREKLLSSQGLCASDGAIQLLEAINRSLAKYCLDEARKATQRGDFGTAYVYLATANFYAPDDANVAPALSQARSNLEDRTRVNVGVVFENKSNYRNYQSTLQEFTGEIESIATRVGLAQPVMMERSDAVRAWRSLQSGGQMPAPTAIFSGDLVAAHAKVTETQRRLRGSYEVQNPDWKAADKVHDEANARYKQCKKQVGADCSGLEQEVRSHRGYRDRIPERLTHYYNYTETSYQANGAMRLTLRYADSITRSVRTLDPMETSITDQCVARDGVPDRTSTGWFSSSGPDISNQSCAGRIKDETGYIDAMTARLKDQARQQAHNMLQDLPLSYYKRARGALNKAQSVEDYLRFLFLTNNKDSAEALEAKRFLITFDTELKTDGVLR